MSLPRSLLSADSWELMWRATGNGTEPPASPEPRGELPLGRTNVAYLPTSETVRARGTRRIHMRL